MCTLHFTGWDLSWLQLEIQGYDTPQHIRQKLLAHYYTDIQVKRPFPCGILLFGLHVQKPELRPFPRLGVSKMIGGSRVVTSLTMTLIYK